ncbi:unnamed protein product [Caenorhabditis auriculariae]|uniref:G protein-coupled receptor n=1 Tax=Caenorhabditis auriculariae TaxID=2777116 RepID=A0A8S1HU09_9PELO|nr:unnamed protein product [Caenorhabditis auriculariae]
MHFLFTGEIFRYSFFLHALSHCVILTVLSFAYRFYVISKSAPSRSSTRIAVFLVYLPSFIVFIIFCYGMETDQSIIKESMENRPDIPWNISTFVITKSVFSPSVAYCSVYLTVFSTFNCISIIVIRRKVQLILKNSASSLSSATRRTHANLIKALSIQASLPFLMHLADVLFALTYLFPIHYSILENAIFWLTSFPPALSPIIYIHYVRPYRNAVEDGFRRCLGMSNRWRPTAEQTSHTHQAFSVSLGPTL